MINLSYIQPMKAEGGRYKPLKGKTFNRLFVLMDLRDVTRVGNDQHMCLCECSCGNQIVLSAHSLSQHYGGSCGCLKQERTTTHGMSTDRFYKIFIGINRRCNNKNSKNYKNYGGRGIKCLWTSFEEFKKDMYESYQKHFETHNGDTTIDRIDVNGNYCKENCRWITRSEQLSTKRDCHQIDDGSDDILSWKSYCRKYSITYETILYYIKKKGLSFMDAVNLWKFKHNIS